jgi:hypothetical protein
MEKEVAQSLLSLAVSLDASFGAMYAEARKFANKETRSKFDKAIGNLMGYVARDIIFPIVNEYPDLNPDK